MNDQARIHTYHELTLEKGRFDISKTAIKKDGCYKGNYRIRRTLILYTSSYCEVVSDSMHHRIGPKILNAVLIGYFCISIYFISPLKVFDN